MLAHHLAHGSVAFDAAQQLVFLMGEHAFLRGDKLLRFLSNSAPRLACPARSKARRLPWPGSKRKVLTELGGEVSLDDRKKREPQIDLAIAERPDGCVDDGNGLGQQFFAQGVAFFTQEDV